eukprot:m.52826 g.52826  ORF g.52826 m.52826 type:complete len:392 (+) comp18313_c0_seq3:723-1898(+)
MMSKIGLETSPVHMKVSFGKNAHAWNNGGKEHETELVRRLRPEIRRFGCVLKWVDRLKLITTFIPIGMLLRWLRFSDDFRNYMVFPLVALFFGTGNQTPHVSSSIIAAVFRTPDLQLFDYDPDLLLSQTPKMFAFPPLGNMYDKYRQLILAQGGDVALGRGVACVKRKKRSNKYIIIAQDENGQEEEFDEVVFACNAEIALRLLDQPSWKEKKILGNVKYFDDVTVTHEDQEYMEKYYDLDNTRGDQYFVRIDPENPECIDMSFDLTNYQPRVTRSGRHIYQTIFLDAEHRERWNIDEINPDKIILKKWWRQMSHTYGHFLGTVPWIRFIQNTSNTWYCGAYTLINTHEIATISGLAVAHRLGAAYPFGHDPLARKQFAQYLSIAHGKRLG